ncbi:MAG: helix-hairpin-helix domain-containing protein [Clostridiales bacterium]|nr:helix-hairpin-helix domain-containing protein [Candidatus Crickella caballi]
MDNVTTAIKHYFSDLVSDKKKLIKILLITFILLMAFGIKTYENKNNDITIDSAEVEAEEAATESIPMYVDISGAVKAPGVYEVDSQTRLYEVIEKAGGLTEDANIDSINRAAFVEDGQKIIIPGKDNTAADTGLSSASEETSSAASASPGSKLININTASKDELKQLNGVGDAIAERIIEYRSSTPFKSVEDIMSVKGIGTATFEKMKSQITV